MSLIIIVVLLFAMVKSDLPVHCVWPSMEGKWKFTMTNNSYDKDVVWKCTYYEKPPMEMVEELKVELSAPNVVTDLTNNGNTGTFTIVYDQALEVTLDGKIYLAYFDYKRREDDGKTNVDSYCNRTLTGWYHDFRKSPGEYPINWGCFQGAVYEDQKAEDSRIHEYVVEERTFKIPTEEDIQEINSKAKTWKAVKYPDSHYKQVFKSSSLQKRPGFAPMKFEQVRPDVRDLPTELDWRDYKGKDYVSPVRNQGGCGSCYAFGATAMYEARARIESDLSWEPVLSPQDIIDCSTYNQGCQGGFPYTVSRWGQDLGLIDDSCDPYHGSTKTCDHKCPEKDKRTFIDDVEYVGGYYGACNEELMLEEIQKGPMAVSFEVYGDFYSYSHGIYHHKEDSTEDPNWEITNHCVLALGYGVEDGTKYWIVKNSWGSSWGEKGFFKIIRGIDNCSIESIAVSASTVLKS